MTGKYDPVLHYHLSDRDFNRRTFYLVLGLWFLVGGGMALRMLGLN